MTSPFTNNYKTSKEQVSKVALILRGRRQGNRTDGNYQVEL